MQIKRLQSLAPLLLTPAVAGCILAILAPLGTDSYKILERFSFWIGLCLAGGLGAGAAEYIALRFTRSRKAAPLSRWPLAIMQSLGATALVSLFLFQILPQPNYTSIALSLFYIWVIAITISAIGALQKGTVKTAQTPKITAPALINRLKPALRNEVIYALEAQDHYVRVITSGGEDLILMRLSDAIAEITPLAGLTPHRSWWVADAGTKTVSRRAGKAVITLQNGENAPVSRNRLKTLRAAGWL